MVGLLVEKSEGRKFRVTAPVRYRYNGKRPTAMEKKKKKKHYLYITTKLTALLIKNTLCMASTVANS
jgi:hypothetical protein